MQGMNYVYAVYKAGSFSAAAQKLFMTQPALSAAVKKIEKELGMTIFDRSRSPLRLTDAGHAYIEAAEKIFQVQKNLKRYVDDLAELKTGTLSIGGTNFVTACFMPRLIKSFNEQYPHIRLSVTESDSTDLFARLREGQLDLVIDSGKCAKDFEAQTFFTDHILLAVPKMLDQSRENALSQEDIIQGKHIQEKTKAANLNDFATLPFLLLNRGNDMYRRATELLQETGISPHVRLYLNQLMTAFHMTAAGLGATFLTDTLIRMAAPNDSCNYYRLNHPLMQRKIFIAAPRGIYRPHAVQAFWQGVVQGNYKP